MPASSFSALCTVVFSGRLFCMFYVTPSDSPWWKKPQVLVVRGGVSKRSYSLREHDGVVAG